MEKTEQVVITQGGEEFHITDDFAGYLVVDLTPDERAAIFGFWGQETPVLMGVYCDHDTATAVYEDLVRSTAPRFNMPAPDPQGAFLQMLQYNLSICDSAPGWKTVDAETVGESAYYYRYFFNLGAMSFYNALTENGYIERNKKLEKALMKGFSGLYFSPEWNGTL